MNRPAGPPNWEQLYQEKPIEQMNWYYPELEADIIAAFKEFGILCRKQALIEIAETSCQLRWVLCVFLEFDRIRGNMTQVTRRPLLCRSST